MDVFRTFLMLGLTSFGGPIAHLGYFHRVFVIEKRWLSEDEYGRLLALCQFLPGPASSQLGFAIGYKRKGLRGALAAFVGFTLPSFLLMWFIAVKAIDYGVKSQYWLDIVHGLKLLAVIVVADAVVSMYRKFCQSAFTRGLAYLSAVVLVMFGGVVMQISMILLAGCLGWLFTHSDWRGGWSVAPKSMRENRGIIRHQLSLLPLIAFACLLVGLPLVTIILPSIGFFSDFYAAGSWVFGGGHVVLPLLQGLIGGAIDTDQFLTGYAAAQAVPGPMFTMATYLGALLVPGSPLLGAILATIAIFLPGFLLVMGMQKLWMQLSAGDRLRATVAGVNAAVVGLLGSALFNPVFVSSVSNGSDFAIVIAGFFLLRYLHVSVYWLILATVLTSVFLL